MSNFRVTLVDAYPLRRGENGIELLTLRRCQPGRSPGSWEAVHGHIEMDEKPMDAALREIVEETGLRPERVYNLSRVETIYLHKLDEVSLVPAFAVFVHEGEEIRLSAEHDAFEWLTLPDASARLSWPRCRRMLHDIAALFADGDAGSLEDALRIH